MARGDPVSSPYVLEFGDYLHDPGVAPDDHVIRITITFNSVSRVITGVQIFRASDCLWHKILVGLGADGTPDSSTTTFDVGNLSGNRSISPSVLAAAPWNVTTIEQFMAAGQITAGP